MNGNKNITKTETVVTPKYVSFDIVVYTYWKEASYSDDTVLYSAPLLEFEKLHCPIDDLTNISKYIIDYIYNNQSLYVNTDNVRSWSKSMSFRKTLKCLGIQFVMTNFSKENICTLFVNNVRLIY